MRTTRGSIAGIAVFALALGAVALGARVSAGDGEAEKRAHAHAVLLYSKDALLVNVGQPITLDQLDTSAHRRLRIVVQSHSVDSTPAGGFVNVYTISGNVTAHLGGVELRACASAPKQPVSGTAVVDFPGTAVVVQAGATNPAGTTGQATIDVRILGSD